VGAHHFKFEVSVFFRVGVGCSDGFGGGRGIWDIGKKMDIIYLQWEIHLGIKIFYNIRGGEERKGGEGR
jgi:hypothetical protein